MHRDATDSDKAQYYNVLLSFSIGMPFFKDVKLSQLEVNELVSLWTDNYYDF